MAYPNEYCGPCNQTPLPTVEAPPVCVGTPCAELYNTQCTTYDGPDIECLNIVSGEVNMNEVITIFSQIFCTCLKPIITGTGNLESVSIVITNPLTSADLFIVEYGTISRGPYNVLTPALETGVYTFDIEGLTCGTTYYIRVKKVCLASGGETIPLGSYSEYSDEIEVETLECV